MDERDIESFAHWIEDLMRARGYDIESPRGGGRTRLAADAGVHRAAITRLLQRKSVPDIATMRALAPALGVGMRDMLIHSGRMAEEDLPVPTGPSARPRRVTAGSMSAAEAAELLGVPEHNRAMFVAMTEMMVRDAEVRPQAGRRTAGG
ncbi:hypothetical protein [Embleya sp. MST-111070]|uniref:hypothetical protein n=1 Tax=Embleya sp. MST-111070 TaxID=3398231 RepID=UPI003F7359FB